MLPKRWLLNLCTPRQRRVLYAIWSRNPTAKYESQSARCRAYRQKNADKVREYNRKNRHRWRDTINANRRERQRAGHYRKHELKKIESGYNSTYYHEVAKPRRQARRKAAKAVLHPMSVTGSEGLGDAQTLQGIHQAPQAERRSEGFG